VRLTDPGFDPFLMFAGLRDIAGADFARTAGFGLEDFHPGFNVVEGLPRICDEPFDVLADVLNGRREALSLDRFLSALKARLVSVFCFALRLLACAGST